MSKTEDFKIKDGVLVKYIRKGGDVVIPDGVTSIGDYAFYDCKSLTSVEIPNSVTSIGESVFNGCKSLTSVVIPNSVTSIGPDAFSNCNSLIYNEKDGLHYLGNEENKYLYLAETTNKNIATAIVDSNCKFIGESFRECRSLTSVFIPNSVTSIGADAFWWCCSLTSIEIPNSVTSIGNYAFYGCQSLTSVVISNSVTSIGAAAFWGCCLLTSIEIPNSVTSIGIYAFCDCSKLTNIEIPNSVTSIGGGAFANCNSLIYNEKDGLHYLGNEENKYLYLSETTNKNITTAIIDSNCKFIGSYAFDGCSKLKSVIMPNNAISIGRRTFRGCGELTSIEIPNSVTSIDYDAFSGCDRLQKVYYKGTADDWKGITFGDCNTKLKKATRFYYIETKPVRKANYWHYDENGKIVIW